MVDHDTTNWDPAQTESQTSFEGASFAADNWVADIGTQDSAISLFGSKSLKNSYSGAHSGPDGHIARYYPSAATLSPPYWVRVYLRSDTTTLGDGSWPDTYSKIISHYQFGVNALFLDWTPGAPPTSCTVIDSTNHPTSSFVFVEKRWHCVEERIPSAGSPQCLVYFDGALIFDDSSVFTPPTSAAEGLEFDTNRGSTGAGYFQQTWHDGVVLSSTRVGLASRVEISNNSTHGAGTLVYQLPEKLSDTSNQVNCDLTGLGAGPYYLFVTNNRGETSAAFNLSGGGFKPQFSRAANGIMLP